MKCFLIDPEDRSVSEVLVDQPRQLMSILDCDLPASILAAPGVVLWYDDRAFLAGKTAAWAFQGSPDNRLGGRALVHGIDPASAQLLDAPGTAEDLASVILWDRGRVREVVPGLFMSQLPEGGFIPRMSFTPVWEGDPEPQAPQPVHVWIVRRQEGGGFAADRYLIGSQGHEDAGRRIQAPTMALLRAGAGWQDGWQAFPRSDADPEDILETWMEG